MDNFNHTEFVATRNNYNLVAEIAKNNAGEQEAIEGYFRMLSMSGLPVEFYDDVREIISDEMNHTEKLSSWQTRLSGVRPAVT
jgi:rubrerythrin